MYKNIYVKDRFSDKPEVHLWDSEEGHMKLNYNKKIYIRSERGNYESLYGETLAEVPASKLDYSTEQKLKNQYGEGRAIYQSDLRVETQVLSDIYQDDDEPSEDIEVFFFDIEVSMEGELPNIDTANNPITSIAYNIQSTGESEVVILDKEDELEAFEYEDVNIIPFDKEDEMLYYFVQKWRDVGPDIVSGWNSDHFDIPYLYRRISRVITNDYANKLSPIEEVDYRENRGMRGEGRFIIAGVNALDYLALYKNFTFTEENSYALDAIASKELDRGKVEYEGKVVENESGEEVVIQDLDDLKEYDIESFVEYNMEDVWLVRDLDKKFDFVELARKIAHLGHVPYEDIYMSSRYIDGAIVTRLNKRGIIAPNVRRITNFEIDGYHSPGVKEVSLKSDIHPDVPKRGTIGIDVSSATTKKLDYKDVRGNQFILEEPTDFEIYEDYNLKLEFEGAYVKEPDPGLYEWIYDLDLTSMYPSIIMSLNISPETLVGKIYDWDAEEFLSEDKTYDVWIFEKESFVEFSSSELEKFLDKGEYSVAANGAFYRNDKRGIIPEVLEEWFTLRQSYKSERNEWREKEGEEAEEKAEYYDKLQHVHKILINCFTPDHEVMTKEGVKNIEDVEVGELVYSVDPETGKTEFKSVKRTYKQDNYRGEVIDFENSFVNFTVTPNHDMVYGDEKIYKEEAIESLKDKSRRRMWSHNPVRKDSPTHVSLKDFCERLDIDYKYDRKNDLIKDPRNQSNWIENTYSFSNFLRFCGWYVSEGSLYKSERKDYESMKRGESFCITLSNKKEEERNKIRSLLETMSFSFHENHKEFEIGNKIIHQILKEEFGKGSYNKKLPDWVWDLDGFLLRNLLETAYLGDGNKRGFRYNTVSEELADDFVQLAYHCGYRANNRGFDTEDSNCYRISFYDRSRGVSPVVKDEHREEREYEGSIVCLEVEDNHTVLAGKNGKFNWTGQSVYGVLGLPTFRFYSIYTSESVTLTGQQLIKYTQKMGDHYYNRKIGQDVEMEDGSEMSIDLYDTYRVKRSGEIKEIKGKKLQVGDEIVIDEES